MAINLNTLTNASTSGDVLAEALTTADFLEPVPVLRNLARGSQKGGDAKQGTALNQPKALPLDANGKGYCYLPVTTGNAPAVTFPTIGSSANFVVEMDVYLVSATSFHFVSGVDANHRLGIHGGQFHGPGFNVSLSSPLSVGVSNIKIERTSGTLVVKQNDSVLASTSNTSSFNFTYLSFNGQFSTSILPLNGYIQKATLSIGGTEQLNIDFTATNVRHGDTKFKCGSGQVVTINQAGNDPATVIKKSVLRFDGDNSSLNGLFANNIDGGYMFAAFSVLGNGGEANGRVFGVNALGAADYETNSAIFGYNANGNLTAFNVAQHVGMFNDDNGDILQETKITNGSALSKVNNADAGTSSGFSVNSPFFNIATNAHNGERAAIDLEYLALFPSSITDAEADDVRNYINNRNNVFDLKDGFGYYFFDAQKAPAVPITSGSSSWNGRIVGSDNGDANKYATQSTSNDSPVGNGYTVTFADNSDHLDIPSTTQAGWQICGTSLGTFVYRVDNDAVTELNLLGNAGVIRSVGDLYGIILLPASATGADIEEARKLLIDRGASDAVSASSVQQFWQSRNDIVEFKQVDTSSVTSFKEGWRFCASLEIFPPLQAPNCTNFLNAWQGTSALTSFPSGAKLGTSANNVNFTSAWQQSGLTSFPPLDLSTGTNFANSFTSSPLTSFPAGIKMGTAATGDVQFTDTWRDTTLSSFPALDLGNGKFFNGAWRDCHELTSFPSDIKLGTNKTGVGFVDAWRGSGLTSFPALDLSTGTDFNQAFFQATSLEQFGQCDFSNASSFDLCWYYCSSLTTFPSMQLPSATSLNSTWMGCSSLTNFGKLEAPNVTVFRFTWSGSGITTIEDGTLLGTSASSVDFTSAFKNCTALTTLPSNLDLSKGDDFQTAFQNCQSLVDFPANAFDTMGTPQDYCFLNTWLDNNALSAASVENILVSINTSGQSAPSTGPEITIKYNTATGTPAYSTLASLKSKGWVIIVNGVTL
jgi:hypothetical protein